MDQVIAQVAQNVEKQLDNELERLDALDKDDIEVIRQQRIAEMKKRASKKQEWMANGHGEYTEIGDEKEFFTVCNKSENVVCHFYKSDTPRCAIVDMHLKLLAKKHIETRFVKLDVERAPFLTVGEDFRYLGSLLQSDGSIDRDVTRRMNAGWMKWKQLTGTTCDRKMPIKIKGKIYKSVIRPVMLYGAECWATKVCDEKRMHVTEMRMLRWMCGVTRKDRIRNEYIRGSMKVAPIVEKMKSHRLS
ncbi:unnamed protein product [Plutella xylostella]|uniref:(diamondback moth) hypothetical protein n=1 Tax=Plutella xylostella TaxID=51655 RepID=A0A8S4FA88_PLUXY|nr:unnamed protein product [Plutella xylostella]